MAIVFPTAETGSISDINTTPLIDVMLVLLIMFIITIPLQTHAVKVEAARGAPSSPIDVSHNEVTIDRTGTIRWDGIALSQTMLRRYLEQTQLMSPIPELHVRPAPDARYEVVDQVLAIAKRARVTKMGFVHNEDYAAL